MINHSSRITHPPMTRRGRRRPQRGAVMFLAMLMIIASLAAAAFCIDVAYMQLVQTQLRSSTDAATRAGALGLATGSVADARQAAKDIALLNEVAGRPLVLDDSTLSLGPLFSHPAVRPLAILSLPVPQSSTRCRSTLGRRAVRPPVM